MFKNFFLILLLSFWAATSQAAIITFTHTGTGSGVIDGVPFADANFVITAIGDTANRVDRFDPDLFPYQVYTIDHDVASIDIVGVGTFNFITDTHTFVNNDLQVVGFTEFTGSFPEVGDLFQGPYSEVFTEWNMLDSIGPVTGEGLLLQWDLSPVYTDGGVLYFSDGATAATFEATVIPIPSAIWLFGSGLIGLIGFARRKKS